LKGAKHDAYLTVIEMHGPGVLAGGEPHLVRAFGILQVEGAVDVLGDGFCRCQKFRGAVF
jgi:hypothetical protein